MNLKDLKEELKEAGEIVVPVWVYNDILQTALAGGVSHTLRCNNNYDSAMIAMKLRKEGYTTVFDGDNYGEWWTISGWQE